MWAIYKEECAGLGMVPLSRSTFYKFMSNRVFKDMKPYECACSACVDFGDAAFAFLEEGIAKLSGDVKKELAGAVSNQQLFYKAHYKRVLATHAALPDDGPDRPCQSRACLSLALGRPGKEFGPPCCKHHVDTDDSLKEIWAVIDAVEKAVAHASFPEDPSADSEETALLRRDHELEFEAMRAQMTSYIAHLARKAADDISLKKLMQDLRPRQAYVCFDYSEKIDPGGHVETQTERFAKSGMSLFGATANIKTTNFSDAELVATLSPADVEAVRSQRIAHAAGGEEEGDFVVFHADSVAEDAKQVCANPSPAFLVCELPLYA
jgi:hypothetical protein